MFWERGGVEKSRLNLAMAKASCDCPEDPPACSPPNTAINSSNVRFLENIGEPDLHTTHPGLSRDAPIDTALLVHALARLAGRLRPAAGRFMVLVGSH